MGNEGLRTATSQWRHVAIQTVKAEKLHANFCMFTMGDLYCLLKLKTWNDSALSVFVNNKPTLQINFYQQKSRMRLDDPQI